MIVEIRPVGRSMKLEAEGFCLCSGREERWKIGRLPKLPFYFNDIGQNSSTSDKLDSKMLKFS